MVEQELVNWARQRLAKGFSKNQIKQELEKAGYNFDEISEVLKSLDAMSQETRHGFSLMDFLKEHLTGLVFVFVIIILLVGITFIYKHVGERVRDFTTPENALAKIIKEELETQEKQGISSSTRDIVLIPGDSLNTTYLSNFLGSSAVFCSSSLSETCEGSTEVNVCPQDFFIETNEFLEATKDSFSVKRNVKGKLRVSRACGLVFVGFKPE